MKGFEHPNMTELAQFIEKTLEGKRMKAVRGHLAECVECRRHVIWTVDSMESRRSGEEAEISPEMKKKMADIMKQQTGEERQGVFDAVLKLGREGIKVMQTSLETLAPPAHAMGFRGEAPAFRAGGNIADSHLDEPLDENIVRHARKPLDRKKTAEVISAFRKEAGEDVAAFAERISLSRAAGEYFIRMDIFPVGGDFFHMNVHVEDVATGDAAPDLGVTVKKDGITKTSTKTGRTGDADFRDLDADFEPGAYTVEIGGVSVSINIHN